MYLIHHVFGKWYAVILFAQNFYPNWRINKGRTSKRKTTGTFVRRNGAAGTLAKPFIPASMENMKPLNSSQWMDMESTARARCVDDLSSVSKQQQQQINNASVEQKNAVHFQFARTGNFHDTTREATTARAPKFVGPHRRTLFMQTRKSKCAVGSLEWFTAENDPYQSLARVSATCVQPTYVRLLLGFCSNARINCCKLNLPDISHPKRDVNRVFRH